MKRIFLIFILLSTVSLYSQVFAPEELQIIKLQDERTFGKDNELINYLEDRNNAVVIRALWAIGNVGKEEGVRFVSEKLFSSRTDEIRVAAAYSLG